MADQYVVIDSGVADKPSAPLQSAENREKFGPPLGGLPEGQKPGVAMPAAMPTNMMPPGYKPPPSFQPSNLPHSNPGNPGEASPAQKPGPVSDVDSPSKFPKGAYPELSLPKQSFGPPGFGPPGSQMPMVRPMNPGLNPEQKPSLPAQGDQQLPWLGQPKTGFMLPPQKVGPWIGAGAGPSQVSVPGSAGTGFSGPPMPSAVKPESPDKPKFVPGWPIEEKKVDRGNPPFGEPVYQFKASTGAAQQSGGGFKMPVRQPAEPPEPAGKGLNLKPNHETGLGKPALLFNLESITGLKESYTDWTCPKCTLENPIEFYQCDACLEENKPLQKLLELVNKPGKLREKGKIGKGLDKVKGWLSSFTSDE